MFMYNPYYSANPENAGQSYDEPEIKGISEKLKSNGWLNEKVTYHFNKYGFRGEDFKTDNNICFVGCSITLGSGLNMEDTFSQIVANRLGMNNCNLAKGGGSMDTMFRIAYHWLPMLKPKITVMVATGNTRSEYYDSETQRHEALLPSMTKRNAWYMNYLCDKNNYEVNFAKNKYALHHLCKQINTNIIWLEHGPDFGNKVDLAKDLLHPGKESNRLMAEKVLQCIKEKGIA